MKRKIKDVTVFGMLGAMMYVTQLILSALPNIHLTGVLIVAATVVYRVKALYPIYIYVFMMGLFNGFNTWWLPYLYIWTVLWAFAMLIPKRLPNKVAPIVYMVVCSLHGFLYGILYAPSQALIMGLDFEKTIAWVAAGLPFDIIHGVSNLLCGILIYPLVKTLNKCEELIK
ncbi:MAG: hypothetical protein E7652_03640 [Ruminococcaceae bacterium]|nr:hypothetical protein [Oscillospiraceae bacterium]